MFLWLFVYFIYFIIPMKCSLIPMSEINKNTYNICWGDRRNSHGDNLPKILNSFEKCLRALRRYSGIDKPELYQILENNIYCTQPYLFSEYYSGNIGMGLISEAKRILSEVRNEGDILPFRENVDDYCKGSREIRSVQKIKVFPLFLSDDVAEKERACETLSKLKKDPDKETFTTPQLDDNENPTKLKVPTSANSDYHLDNPEAGVALTKYYVIVIKCLSLNKQKRNLVLRFNQQLYDWITNAVLPHLANENKLYPGFGGVLRILETMKENDWIPPDDVDDIETPPDNSTDSGGGKMLDSKYLAVVFLPWTILIVLLFMFVAYALYTKLKWFYKRKYLPNSPSTSDLKMFYQIEEDTTSCSMLLDESSRSTGRKSYSTLDAEDDLGEVEQEKKKKSKKKRRKNKSSRSNNNLDVG
uniref:Uncharacterized protein n=1 Tax=Clastoptera arizonana TaxID=38151 RepID=A0A1B6CVF7_9HEMI